MKKTGLLTTVFFATTLLFSSEVVFAKTNDSFVIPIRGLVDEVKTSYYKVIINITEQEPTLSPFNKVRDDYIAGQSSSIINVPADQALHVLYLIMEDEAMLDREAKTLKNIKIELKSATPVTLAQEFPIGIYKNTWLKLDDTITIDGRETSPMLTNIKIREVNPYSLTGYQPYNQNSNVVVEGGIWDSNRDENKVTSQGFTLGNASNVYVKNVTIKDVAGGHGIDAAGINGLVVENSQFLGSAMIGGESDRDYNEAIQLDQMASSGPFSGSENSWGYFDGSVTKNVYIANNTFGASNNPSTVPWHVGIGSHSVVKGVPYENIIVYKNNFYSMDNAGMRMTNYKNVLVSNNYFRKNAHGIKIYSTNYAFDYKDNKINNNVLYPAINDDIIIKNNTFNYIPKDGWGVHVNSIGYDGGANGATYNVKILNNIYQNSDTAKAFYQNFAYNTQISDAHYHINGYVIDKAEADKHVNELKGKGLDANYQEVFDQQVYRIELPNRFTSKKTAEYTAHIIKKAKDKNGVDGGEWKGVPAFVKEEAGGKYYVYTDYIIGEKRAKEIEYFIKNNMQYTYEARAYNADHPNNLYRVGITERFNTEAQAKKMQADFKKYANANAVYYKEASGKWYVRTSNLVGRKRAESVEAIMKQKTGYKAFDYNTKEMRYYKISVHPFYGKTFANNQANHLKYNYNWMNTSPVIVKD